MSESDNLPVTCPLQQIGVWIQLYTFLTWTLDGVGDHLHSPAGGSPFTGGWIGLGSSVDRYGKQIICCSYRSLNLEPFTPYRVALPATLSYPIPTPYRMNEQNRKYSFKVILGVQVHTGSLCDTDFKIRDAAAQNVYFSLVGREPTVLLIASETSLPNGNYP